MSLSASDLERIPGSHPGGAEYRIRKHGAAMPVTMPVKSPTGPNKTELAALRVLNLEHAGMEFEGRTFVNPGGGQYTVDWYSDHLGLCVECKGEYIHDRGSRPKFDAAKAAHPELTWVWCRKREKGTKGTRWEVEIYEKNP